MIVKNHILSFKQFIFNVLLISIFSFSCSPSLQKSFDEIERTYKVNNLDFEALKKICISLYQKYPKSTIEIVYGYNSKSMFVSRSEEGEIVDARPDLFDKENFGITSDKINDICNRNEIIYLKIEGGGFKTSFSFAQPRGWSVKLVFATDGLVECNETRGNNPQNVCEELGKNFYIVGSVAH